MAVKKLFWDDPYLALATSRVATRKDDRVTLDQTIIYAFSGGQQSDSGFIGGYEVIEAVKQGKEIYYTLPAEHTLLPGQEVEVAIDWNKRYKLMRLHFAAELILELVYQHFNHPNKIGANINVDKARVDFQWEGNIASTFPLLEEKSRNLIEGNHQIISAFSDEDNEERYWEIKGFARVPCGGTHLKRTGEVGNLRLKRVNLGGGKERIEIYLLNQR